MSQQGSSLGGVFLFGQWVLATAAGWTIGFSGIAFVIVTFHPRVPFGISRVAVYLVGVFGVAVLQLLVLRKHIEQWGLWMLFTFFGIALGIVAILILSGVLESALMEHDEDLVGIALVLAVAFYGLGTTIGAAQWLHLRRQYMEAGWWVLANAVSWATGAVSVIVAGMITNGRSEWLAYTVGGAVTGAISGFFLLQLLQHPIAQTAQERSPSPNPGTPSTFL